MSNGTTVNGTKDEKIWYDANCHCGNVRYKLKLEILDRPTTQVNSCNCSICTKNGYMLVYPSPKEVVWHSGYDSLKDYRFGRKQLDHKFCPNCASSILIDFHNPEKWALNVSLYLSRALAP